MAMLTLDQATLAEALSNADRPLLVEFRADWCGPCRQLEPVLARLAEEMAGQLDIATLDFDDHLEVGLRHEVMSLPTMILFVGGQPVCRLIGARGIASLREELGRHLDATPS